LSPSLVQLDVAAGERLHVGVVSGAQADAIGVRAGTRLAVVGYVDPVVDRSGSIDRGRAENAGRLRVGAAGYGKDVDRVDVQAGGGSVVLILLIALRAGGRAIALPPKVALSPLAARIQPP
jgi:hypothetical protein